MKKVFSDNLQGKKLGMIGAGRSGVSVCRHALEMGAEVTLYNTVPLKIQLPEEINQLIGDETIFEPEDYDLIVLSPWYHTTSPVVQKILKSTTPLIGEIEYGSSLTSFPIIAITGTNGKSTTSCLTYHILKSIGKNAVLCGNIMGSGYDEFTLTEAASQNAEIPNTVIVAEVSSAQLEHIYNFSPTVSYITNITPDHLNRYSTFDEYLDVKLKIVSHTKQNGTFILNHHLPENIKGAIQSAPSKNLNFISSTENIQLTDDAIIFHGIKLNRADLPINSPHMIQNISAALTISESVIENMNPTIAEKMLNSIHTFKGLQHRMERVGKINEITIVNNSMCTNPKAIIESSKGIPQKQHILIGGKNKNLDFSEVKSFIESSNHTAYIFGSNVEEILKDIGNQHPCFPNMEAAFLAALDNAKDGETIILSPGCTSFDGFIDFADRGNKFKEFVKSVMNTHQNKVYYS